MSFTVYQTRSAPDFNFESQKELFAARKQLAMLTGFPFAEEYEEGLVGSLDEGQAAEFLAPMLLNLDKVKKAAVKKAAVKKAAVKTAKKGKEPANSGALDPPETSGEITFEQSETVPAESADELGDTDIKAESSATPAPVKTKSADKPSDGGGSDDGSNDGDKNPRRRISSQDKERVRGRTPRIDTTKSSDKGSSLKLFKMDPPKKYVGEKDTERTYQAVHMFLSQLSRYLRLATNVDMDKDITEYVLGFLDGFAYCWFETLDKGEFEFRWVEFEAVFRDKFIPREYIQQALDKYLAIKQTGTVGEYIVERENLENTLGKLIPQPLKESSFRRGLDSDMRRKMQLFRELPFDEYKAKAESIGNDMKDMKTGPYAPKSSSSSGNSWSTVRSKKPTSSTSTPSAAAASTTVSTSASKKPTFSRSQKKELGLCFRCGEKGHLIKDCPKPPKTSKGPESNAVGVINSGTKAVDLNQRRIESGGTNRRLHSRGFGSITREVVRGTYPSKKPVDERSERDERSYSSVVSNHSFVPNSSARSVPGTTVPTISVVPSKAEETSETPSQRSPPMYAFIPINGVPAKVLCDTGASDDFVATHFVTTNRLPIKKHDTPLAIQQAVQGSKPKSNGTSKLTIKFGTWTKNTTAHIAGLAGYDAILGMPTLIDGDAVIDVRARKVTFRQWGVTFDCVEPEEPPKPPRYVPKWTPKSNAGAKAKSQSNIAKFANVETGVFPAVATATTQIVADVEVEADDNVDKKGSPEYYRNLLINEFHDVLVDELPNELPPLREINHHIPYHPKTPWVAHKYRLPEAQRAALERDVNAKLASGIMRYTSDIPLAPSHMVPKKDGQYRHVQGLRKRNLDTDTMAWPLPDQEELVHSIARSTNASFFDLISAFDQTRIDLKDEQHATIINHMGILQRVIQQGDKNAVATQQWQMQHTLRKLWGKSVVVYIDDGTIFDEESGMSPYQHYRVCQDILLTLRTAKFYLSHKKTRFFVDMVNEGMDVLGRHIQNGGISVAKPKIDAFIALRSPTSFQELGKDLGTFTWLTDHLPLAAKLSAPLHTLLHSGRWEWTETHENAFRALKEVVGGPEMLYPLDLKEGAPPIQVVSDASLVGGGGWICQGETIETARPAVYHSRVFNPAQSNYPVHEQELLALQDLIESYEHWLIGRPFIAVTDSQPMLALLKQKYLSHRQMRTVLYLSKFDITWEFVPGKKNIIADLLSRIAERSTYRHDLPVLEEDDSHLGAIQLRRGKVLLEQPVLKKRPSRATVEHDEHPLVETSAITSDLSSHTEPSDSASSSSPDDSPLPSDQMSAISLSQFLTAIVEGYKTDTQFSKVLTAGVDSGIYTVDSNGLLYLAMPGAHRVCIPDIKVGKERSLNLRELLISHAHEIVAHRGFGPTHKRLQGQFYWKTMSSDVFKYVKSCHSCQTRNTSPTKQYGKNHPLPVPPGPWQFIQWISWSTCRRQHLVIPSTTHSGWFAICCPKWYTLSLQQQLSRRKELQGCILSISIGYMGCRKRLFLTEIQSSLVHSGVHCKRWSEQS
jgi:hypothetical protein